MAGLIATLGPRRLPTIEEAFILEGRARPKGSALAGEGHPGSLVEPASGNVLPGRPDSDTPVADRARDVEDVKDEGEPDSCALRGGTHEYHRDVQERWIGVACAVVEPSRLGQRHAYDVWSRRYKRQSVWG